MEQAMTEGGHVVSLSSLLDMVKTEEDDEVPVGFSNKIGKLRRKNV